MLDSSNQGLRRMFQMLTALLLGCAGVAPSIALAQHEMDEMNAVSEGRTISFRGSPSDQAYRRAQEIYNKSVADQFSKELFEDCDRDDAVACARLSGRYSPTAPGSKDEYKRLTDKAWKIAKAKCDEQKPASCRSLGDVYLIVGNDREQAQRLFKAGCDADDAVSCNALGNSYYTQVKGKVADQDDAHAKALTAYNKACSLNFAAGCFHVGQQIHQEAKRVQLRSMMKDRVVRPIVLDEAMRKAVATAKEYYERALAIDPEFTPARNALMDLDHQEYFDSIAKALES